MSNIIINGHHLTITPAIQQHVNKKLDKLNVKFNHITQINIILKTNNLQHIAEAEIHLAGNRGVLFAKDENKDMYTAINNLYKKLNKQLLTYIANIKDKKAS